MIVEEGRGTGGNGGGGGVRWVSLKGARCSGGRENVNAGTHASEVG